MESSDTSPFLLRIHPADNVAVLTRSIQAGEEFQIRGQSFRFPHPLCLGHKIAVSAVDSGGKIFKYGAAIGSAIRPIAAGEHVHLHNMKSDYLPTYTLDEQHRFTTA